MNKNMRRYFDNDYEVTIYPMKYVYDSCCALSMVLLGVHPDDLSIPVRHQAINWAKVDTDLFHHIHHSATMDWRNIVYMR